MFAGDLIKGTATGIRLIGKCLAFLFCVFFSRVLVYLFSFCIGC
jgi:hypothetical protein